MKRGLFLVLSLVVVMTMLVPIAFAGGPPPPKPPPCCQPTGEIVGTVSVDYQGPNGVNQNETAQGLLIFTVTSEQLANVPDVKGKGYVASGYDLWCLAFSDGNVVGGGYQNYNDFISSGGEINYNLSGNLVLTIPITVGPGSYIGGYADSIQWLSAGNKCGNLNLWEFISAYRVWFIKSLAHQRWTHLAERKLQIHNNVEGRILELGPYGMPPIDGAKGRRDTVLHVGVNEVFCSAIGGGCSGSEWTEQGGVKHIFDVLPSWGCEGCDLNIYLDLPENAPPGSYPSYGSWVEPAGSVVIDANWSVAHGAPQ
jgi:hypothetical protein